MLMSDVAPARASSHSPFHKLFPVSNEAPYGSELLRSHKHAFITTGESDLLLILDAAEGGNVTKFALAKYSNQNHQSLARGRVREDDFRITLTVWQTFRVRSTASVSLQLLQALRDWQL